ncbi:MAG: carbon-nitrogen hydrolase family protein, partial [Myxococcales bacterium]|nr:carbon-nitrogen hydrolase family protein [Myxococcales bacterium]
MRSPHHTRVAVVQLDFHPAASIDRKSPLADPLFALGKPDSLEPADGEVVPGLQEPLEGLRARVRAAYVEQLRARLEAILVACRGWDVQLVVLPEYSVPWELLPALAEAAGPMVVVAGTHAVERTGRRAGVYEALGWPQAPRSGMAVAPVLHRGRLLALQPKLSAAKPEQRGLVLGEEWVPVDFDAAIGPGLPSPMGVMICLDFLYRERETHRTVVGKGLDRTRFLAVPSFTPWFTVDEFGAKGWEEAKRYGRPVLYTNHASGGGTSLFVDEGQQSELGRFPERVGVLGPGEEGVLVADVNLGYERTGKSTRYGDVPVVVPVAAASLVYRHHPAHDRYAAWSLENARLLESEDARSVDDEVDRIEASRAVLVDAASLSGAVLRRRRLHR